MLTGPFAAESKRHASCTDDDAPVFLKAGMCHRREVQARIVASTARLAAQVALEFPPPALGPDDPVQGQVALQMEAWKALESAGNDSDDDEGKTLLKWPSSSYLVHGSVCRIFGLRKAKTCATSGRSST